MNAGPPGSDPVYKRLYAFPEMVADLLRSLFPDDALGADYDSLRRLPAEYVGDDYRQRRGDSVWQLRADAGVPADGGARHGGLYVLLMLEFQARNDRGMAVRILEYTAMLYRELLREVAFEGGGELPPVLPVVLYNGDAPWRSASEMRDLVAKTGPALAPFQPSQRHVVLDERHVGADDAGLKELTRAVVLLEQSRTAADLARVAESLTGWLAAPSRRELAAAFADWLWLLLRRLDGAPASVDEAGSGELSLEEVRMTLAERVAEWPKPYIRQGREEGIGIGREEGIGIGREEGIAHERQLLRRQAAARFGAPTADRLADVLADESDPERLAEYGEAIVRCATGDELLAEVGVSK